ncbi:MAG TPA: response regulator [Chloroflexota bacterium]|jgi:two-component system OmpR family response regulator
MPIARPVVLVLDDDRTIRELVQEVLEEQGYAVEAAPTGSSGQARLEAGGIDLVVLDKLLPDRDGAEVCQWVRARERDAPAHLPIILVSAALDEGAAAALRDAGADGYLPKPFDIDALIAAVRARLETTAPPQ